MDLLTRARTEQIELATRKETLLGEVARVDARLSELDTFIRVAESYSTGQTDDSGNREQTGNGSGKSDDKELRRGDQKRMIEEALQANRHGLTKAGITQWVETKYGLTIAPNYIGVALDRMKEKKVRLDGNRWVWLSQSEARSQRDQPGGDSP